MSKLYNVELQSRIEDFIKATNVSQAKLAPMIGISQTALSQWRNNKYDKGNIEEVESKILEFFKFKDEGEAIKEKAELYKPSYDYVPISTSEDIFKLIRYCQLERGMVVVHGDAGIGKTKAAEKFVRENPTNSIYLQITPSSGTLNSILRMLARALKISESRCKLDLMFDIQSKLEGTNKVIIIDEAQHLKYAALEEIRTLSDPNSITGQMGVGIVLIGNTEVHSRMVGKQEARFAQLFSRIKMNRHYGTHNITKDDIKILFPLLVGKELGFLHTISQSKWGIRGAVNVYNNSVNNECVDYDGLFTMARSMGIGVLS